jgi:pSer/pThr/pTyr-binding forkhead associated (FHA) protein
MLPRLVRVDSPSREVSATHIELRPTQQGLVLTDLESTNGTVVRQPGSGVRRLESGESLAVVPGTLIDIGDGNVIEILAYR